MSILVRVTLITCYLLIKSLVRLRVMSLWWALRLRSTTRSKRAPILHFIREHTGRRTSLCSAARIPHQLFPVMTSTLVTTACCQPIYTWYQILHSSGKLNKIAEKKAGKLYFGIHLY